MKNIKQNIAVVGISGLLMCTGFHLNAQNNMRSKNDCSKRIEFSEQQKEQIQKSKIEFAKATKDLNNEMNELRAKQKTLISADKPDMKAIYANVDKVSDLKNRLRKEQFAMRMEIKSVLTDEQKAQMPNGRMENRGRKQNEKGKMQNGKMHKDGREQGRKMENRSEFGLKGMQASRPNNNWLNFTDEQKVQMNELRIAHQKESKELRDQAEILQLKQKQIMTSETIDKGMVFENMDQLSGIQNQLAKMKIDHKMEVRKLLTEDQLTLFLSHSGIRKGAGKRQQHRSLNN
ncbi:hypothetical protein BZG02_18835 [Labilibaculum filiforme]|uniref:Periplasmic heavy metal sensor n=1 Tax=Labilibaculum filiforme TaxID=1940526 RepID=A0A2N3HR54_9BACT|nr:periplasmic heavy metal sensor [Labilibaculum filiforme]PKQ60522.1 hypothetical protein BZG02_18835 [Labilibaculum filiforme]